LDKTFEKTLEANEDAMDMQIVFDVAHNIVKVEGHTVEEFDDKRRCISNKNLIVPRKGATRAFPAGSQHTPTKYRRIGQPMIIPGSMGTSTWFFSRRSKINGSDIWIYSSRGRKDYVKSSSKKNVSFL
jgi:tRNA-splicing ligase RtcB